MFCILWMDTNGVLLKSMKQNFLYRRWKCWLIFSAKTKSTPIRILARFKITCLGDMPRPPYKRKSTRCCKNLTREYKKESFSGLIQFDVHSCEIPQLIRYKDKRVQWKLYYFGSSTVDPFSEHRFVIVGKLVGLELEIRLLSHPQEAIFAVNEPTDIKMSNLIRTTNVKQQKVLHLWQL